MKRANPDVVGKMLCGTCNNVMEVRQRSNGKKLLYTYCPNCKMDQRSGEAIQNFWRNSMVAPDTEITTLTPEPEPMSEKTELETVVDDDGLGEWVPPEHLDPNAEPKPEDESGSSSVLVALAAGVVVLTGAVFGVRMWRG